jgi:hypothetical protein|tara:strand:+ start:378 stop:824 length:447 start_codon:yes stop_codon:yes gene_type:complete
MKHISVFAVAFSLLFGCQTVGAVSNNDKLITENKEIVPKETPKSEEEAVGLKTAKPVICVNSVKLLTHLKSLGEIPHATWFDEAHGHPVIFLVNINTGSSTLLEYPAMGNIKLPTYEGLACIISSGIGTHVKKLKLQETKGKILKIVH